MAQNKKKNKRVSTPQRKAGIKNLGWKVLSIILAALFAGTAIACAIGWVKFVNLQDQIKTMIPSTGNTPGNTDDGKTPANPEQPNGDLSSGSVIVTTDDNIEMPVRLSALRVATQASTEETYEIVAETDVAGIEFKFDIGYKDSTSEWAQANTDINSFVELEKGTAKDRVTAVCYQAFGEPIIITATALDKGVETELSSTVQLDYLAAVEKFCVRIRRAAGSSALPTEYFDQEENTFSIDLGAGATAFSGRFYNTLSYGVGTVRGEFSSQLVSFGFDEKTQELFSYSAITDVNLDVFLGHSLLTAPTYFTYYLTGVLVNAENYSTLSSNERLDNAKNFCSAWASKINDNTIKNPEIKLCVSGVYTYNGVEQQRFTQTTHFIPVATPTSVTTSPDYVFGTKNG